MATTNIELDIENITGVADANDQFVISAQKFVVSSVPKNLLHFAQKASSASTDGSAISFSVNDSIIDVQRNGYSCREISMSESIWALDSTSLKYATAKHPVWYHKQGSVHFAPVTDGSNAGYVFYVDYSKIDDDSDLRNAVVFHASSSEFSKLSSAEMPTVSIAAVPPDVPSLSTVSFSETNALSISVSAPTAISLTSVTFSSTDSDVDASLPTYTTATVSAGGVYGANTAPAYTKPELTSRAAFNDYWTLGDFGDSDPGALSITSVPPSTPSLPSISSPGISSTTISNVGTPPTYTAPTVGGVTEELTTTMTALTGDAYGTDADFLDFSMWFTTAAELLEDEEDVELATAQLQKIGRYIEAYSTQMQSNLNTFNKEDKEYQAKLQEAIQQAQINSQKAVQQAQIDAQKITQQAQLDSTKTITQAQLDAADAQQEAALLLQKENQEYAAKLQQFSSDLGKYSAEVQAKVQDHAAQINEISAEIQIDSTEYNWMSQRYAALKGQYDQAFGLMAPKEGKD